MLKSEKKFGFSIWHDLIFPNTSDPLYSAILKEALQCPDEPTCFIWAAEYHNISVVIKDFDMESYRSKGNWTDENNRPLLCELEGGVVTTLDCALSVKKGTPYFEFMDDVLGHIIEGGIFMHLKKRSLEKLKVESKFDVPTFDDTYYVINMKHLQTAFYFLTLGYVLAIAYFVTEIMWHRYRSKRRGPTITTLSNGET
jgi:hypothetical protein